MSDWEDVEAEVNYLIERDYNIPARYNEKHVNPEKKKKAVGCNFCNLQGSTIYSAKVEKCTHKRDTRDSIFGRVKVGEENIKLQPMITFKTSKGMIRKNLPVNLKFCPVCGRKLMEDKK